MRTWPIIFCLVSLCAADDAQVRKLITDLGAEDAAVREQATQALQKLGDEDTTGAVEKLVEEAAGSADPEVSARVKSVLDHVRLWQSVVVMGGSSCGGFDVSTGQFVWRRKLWDTAWCGLRKRGGVAYVGDRKAGTVECVDLCTGRSMWKSQATDGDLVGRTIWFNCAEKNLVAISPESGKTLWSAELPEPYARNSASRLSADPEAVYVQTQEHLLAYEVSSGKERWRGTGELFALLHGLPIIGRKEAGKPTRVVRVDPSNGKELWSHDAPRDEQGVSVSATEDAAAPLIVSCHPNETLALDPATGAERWKLDGEATVKWATPDGKEAWMHVEHVQRDGSAWLMVKEELQVIDLATGRAVATFPCGGNGLSQGDYVRDGDHLYVVEYMTISCEIALRAFDWKKRVLLWTSDVQGIQVDHSKYRQSARVEKLGERLVFVVEASGGNSIEVLDPATGKVTTRFTPK